MYANLPDRPSPKMTKDDLIRHCEDFVQLYTKAANEAEALARFHVDSAGATPWSSESNREPNRAEEHRPIRWPRNFRSQTHVENDPRADLVPKAHSNPRRILLST